MCICASSARKRSSASADVQARAASESSSIRCRRDVIVGLLRYYVSELLPFQDSEENPHGPFHLDEGCLNAFPGNGSVLDLARFNGDGDRLPFVEIADEAGEADALVSVIVFKLMSAF